MSKIERDKLKEELGMYWPNSIWTECDPGTTGSILAAMGGGVLLFQAWSNGVLDIENGVIGPKAAAVELFCVSLFLFWMLYRKMFWRRINAARQRKWDEHRAVGGVL